MSVTITGAPSGSSSWAATSKIQCIKKTKQSRELNAYVEISRLVFFPSILTTATYFRFPVCRNACAYLHSFQVRRKANFQMGFTLCGQFGKVLTSPIKSRTSYYSTLIGSESKVNNWIQLREGQRHLTTV